MALHSLTRCKPLGIVPSCGHTFKCPDRHIARLKSRPDASHDHPFLCFAKRLLSPSAIGTPWQHYRDISSTNWPPSRSDRMAGDGILCSWAMKAFMCSNGGVRNVSSSPSSDQKTYKGKAIPILQGCLFQPRSEGTQLTIRAQGFGRGGPFPLPSFLRVPSAHS